MNNSEANIYINEKGNPDAEAYIYHNLFYLYSNMSEVKPEMGRTWLKY